MDCYTAKRDMSMASVPINGMLTAKENSFVSLFFTFTRMRSYEMLRSLLSSHISYDISIRFMTL